jgi:hypothetical protein
MSLITTSSFAKALWPGVNAWYGKAYNEYPTEWDKLFDKNSSTRNYEEDVGLSSFGTLVVKPEGMPITYDTERQGFTTRYTHVVYGLGFIVTREAMDDDQYDVVAKNKAEGLAFSVRQTKELIGASVYNKAFTGSGNPTYGDGQVAIYNAHPNVAGGTQSNTLTTASDLSEAALEQAYIDISLLKNDRGLQISLLPQSLIIPPTLEFEANRILKSSGRVASDANDINALKETGKFSKGIVVNHYLTDPDAWFIRTNAPHGMKYFSRIDDSFSMDNDFDTENAKFKVYSRFAFGMTDWRGIYGSPGA